MIPSAPSAIAIIPARIGSSRLPCKNIKEFHGRPLLAWTIIQARACSYVEEVYVTTDSEKIAEVAREYGARVLMRESYLESLNATAAGVPMVFAARKIAKEWPLETVLSLFCTSPLRKPHDLDRMCRQYFELLEVRGDAKNLTVNFTSPRYETFIARRLDNNCYQMEIADKTFTYMDLCGGSAICSASDFTNQTIEVEDEKSWRDPAIFPPDPMPRPYVTVEWWQCPEIDRQEDFDLCEFFFGRYLKAEWEGIWSSLTKKS